MEKQAIKSRSQKAVLNLRGILIPFTTPFDERGEVDAAALRANIEKWNETGVVGYVALGSTGERVHLDERECLTVIETARGVVPRSMAFIAGAGQQSTRATIAEARRFADAGADALLIITPHFFRTKMTQDALAEHFVAVADALPVPILLYNLPEFTNVSLAPETVARLAAHTNIIGIKDSSGDMLALAEMLRLAHEDFAVMTGNGAALYAALAAGACGAILAAACVAPREFVAIFNAAREGDYVRARDLQQRITPLARAVTARFGIGGLKYAMSLRGYAGGEVRAPLAMPDEYASREIGRLMEEAFATEAHRQA